MCVGEERPQSGPQSVTYLLHRLDKDDAAAPQLMALVYDELRRLAASFMKQERGNHTLQPTALVNEVYIRLVNDGAGGPSGEALTFQNKAHFFGIAAKVMRRVLVDHARAYNADKRGGDRTQVTLDDAVAPSGVTSADVLGINDAIDALAKLHPRMAQVVELRFFGGLTIEQVSAVLGVTTSTIEADWSFARAWLRKTLTGGRTRDGQGA